MSFVRVHQLKLRCKWKLTKKKLQIIKHLNCCKLFFEIPKHKCVQSTHFFPIANLFVCDECICWNICSINYKELPRKKSSVFFRHFKNSASNRFPFKLLHIILNGCFKMRSVFGCQDLFFCGEKTGKAFCVQIEL